MSIDLTGARVCQSVNFLDYVYGGLEINLNVAIDFSMSNRATNDPSSLHNLTDESKNKYI